MKLWLVKLHYWRSRLQSKRRILRIIHDVCTNASFHWERRDENDCETQKLLSTYPKDFYCITHMIFSGVKKKCTAFYNGAGCKVIFLTENYEDFVSFQAQAHSVSVSMFVWKSKKLKETRWISEAKYSFINLPKIIIMNQRAVDSLCCMNVFLRIHALNINSLIQALCVILM